MKFGDLPNADICVKIKTVSFSTPQKNYEVYKFAESIFPLFEYIESERAKIIAKYGKPLENGSYEITGEDNVASYQSELNGLFSLDIDKEIFIPNLEADDFSDKSCLYSKDSNFWMSALEIECFLSFIKKLKNRSES